MTAYYNEIDGAAAAVLRQQIRDGVIAPGVVDSRSIKEVHPDDIKGFAQCHFFAGGGFWSIAARQAGWPDERPIWTGSCPCQPFSAAGKGLGTDDPRHLWPDFHRLIRACRPAVVMGEQVAGKAGYGWFDGVGADLEREGYASRAVDFPACSVDAPHQRNRLYWIAVALAEHGGRKGWDAQWRGSSAVDTSIGARCRALGDSDDHRCGGARISDLRARQDFSVAPRADGRGQIGAEGLHADADGRRRAGRQEDTIRLTLERTPAERSLLRNGTYWSDAIWIECHDGKARRAQPDIRFLVDGLPGRVDLWRVGGNAIVPQAAAEVIAAFLDCDMMGRAA